jgi:ABC-type uncharacterized transport system permease subunit
MSETTPPVPTLPGRSTVLTSVVLYVVSISVALGLSAVMVWSTGGSPADMFSALIDGSLRSPGAWGVTLTTMAPLLLVAVGSIVATRAGLVNIGQEGQVTLGAIFSAYVAVRLGGPGWVVIVVSILFGALGGGVWAGIPAALRTWRKVPEVLTTLLLTFISFPILAFGLKHTWLVGDRDTTRRNHINSGEQLPPRTLLPTIDVFGNEIDTAFVIAVVLAVVVAWVVAHTVLGRRIDIVGLNPRAAQRFGIAQAPLSTSVLIFSGATAGMAGAALLHGGAAGDRLVFGLSSNFGWDGLLVALLARNRIMLALPMAFVFAMLRTGSSFLASTGVDRKATDVVQALLVLALLVPPAVSFVLDRRRQLHASKAGD